MKLCKRCGHWHIKEVPVNCVECGKRLEPKHLYPEDNRFKSYIKWDTRQRVQGGYLTTIGGEPE